MKKVIGFFSNTKSVGMDGNEAFTFDDDTSDEVISKEVHYAACDHIGMFYNLVDDETSDEDFDDASDIREDEVESWWEVYNGENHDNLRHGGGSFEDDFVDME